MILMQIYLIYKQNILWYYNKKYGEKLKDNNIVIILHNTTSEREEVYDIIMFEIEWKGEMIWKRILWE